MVFIILISLIYAITLLVIGLNTRGETSDMFGGACLDQFFFSGILLILYFGKSYL